MPRETIEQLLTQATFAVDRAMRTRDGEQGWEHGVALRAVRAGEAAVLWAQDFPMRHLDAGVARKVAGLWTERANAWQSAVRNSGQGDEATETLIAERAYLQKAEDARVAASAWTAVAEFIDETTAYELLDQWARAAKHVLTGDSGDAELFHLVETARSGGL